MNFDFISIKELSKDYNYKVRSLISIYLGDSEIIKSRGLRIDSFFKYKNRGKNSER